MADHYLKAELYQQMQQDSALFEFIQAGSLDGIWYWDLERPENEWMSPRFWELFGYEADEKPHLASAWQTMIHPDDLELALSNFERHQNDPSHPYDQVVRYRHRDGHWVTVRCRGLIIRDSDNRPVRMLGCHTDLTAQRRIEEALIEANRVLEMQVAEVDRKSRELEKINHQLEEFAHAVSHDLKSPLRGIRTAVDWLESELDEDSLSEKAQESMHFLNSRAKRLGKLIDGVLAYSKAGTQGRGSKELSVDEVLRDVVAGFPPEKRDSINLPEQPVRVIFDPDQLFQIFQNLIANAFEHASPPVEISAEEFEDHFRFSVRDAGPGIDKKHHTRMFDLFTTLRPRDDHESAGAGLSICRTLVERAGGSIGVLSEAGQGASFWFTLPRKENAS